MPLGNTLLIAGLLVTLVGAVLTWAPWLLSWFGRLPGDIRIEKEGSGFYFPIVSMVVISIVVTILMNLLFRR